MSLEPEFWDAFRAIAAKQRKPINQLAAEIDRQRGVDRGLASAIRVYVLSHLQSVARATASQAHPDPAAQVDE